jgi:hypothetical protein
LRKKWYKSKTLWFNVLVAIGAAVEASLSLIEGYFSPITFLTLIAIVAGVNVVLRFISTNGLEK